MAEIRQTPHGLTRWRRRGWNRRSRAAGSRPTRRFASASSGWRARAPGAAPAWHAAGRANPISRKASSGRWAAPAPVWARSLADDMGLARCRRRWRCCWRYGGGGAALVVAPTADRQLVGRGAPLHAGAAPERLRRRRRGRARGAAHGRRPERGAAGVVHAAAARRRGLLLVATGTRWCSTRRRRSRTPRARRKASGGRRCARTGWRCRHADREPLAELWSIMQIR